MHFSDCPQNGNLIRGNCQELHVCMNQTDKQTHFFSKPSSGLQLKWSQSTTFYFYNLVFTIKFQENVIELKTLWTDSVKICLLCSKTNGCNSFIEPIFDKQNTTKTCMNVNCCACFLIAQI